MRLEGIHHVTSITADAQRNLDFYAGVLGLRFVKKTVNFDAPDVYHLYYADAKGSPGSVMTFFEFPGAQPGRAGAGMIHRVAWRVGSEASIDFWAKRLGEAGVEVGRHGDRAAWFEDPEGLGLALLVPDNPAAEPPLRGEAPDVPAEHALLGFEGARAYARKPGASGQLHEALGFDRGGADDREWRVAGEQRHADYVYDDPPAQAGIQGAGTVHHIAWASRDEDHEAWRERAAAGGARPTPIIDRQYFRSIYFREPSGVLFEIATFGPGFDVDEPLEHLGESLRLPPEHEHLRAQLERTLSPLRTPR
jgi:glyoxalase family protein